MPLTITNITKTAIPKADFEAIKNAILGSDYELSFVMATPAKLKKLNTIYRDKTHATDILSFPLNKKEGEIYICPDETRKEAKKFGRTYENFFVYLFIHGCAHLKGHDHGDTMEGLEEKIRKEFKI